MGKKTKPNKLPGDVEVCVKKYNTIHEKIQKLSDKMKELRKEKSQCELTILDFISEFGVCLNVSGVKLRKNEFKSKVPITKDLIKSAITKSTNDKKLINSIISNIENRPIKTRCNLKRTKGTKETKKIKNNKHNTGDSGGSASSSESSESNSN